MAQQRRGLGKGLGALIPETPRPSGESSPAAAAPASPSGPVTGAPSAATPDVMHLASAASADAASGPALQQVDGAYFQEVPVDAITPNPRQPRRTFDEEALDELSASITEVGLLQPVVVRHLGEGKYELVMGERRLRASQRAGLDAIPAIVRETPDTDMLRDALLENLHRQQLDPLEEAAAYQQLLDDFGATHEQLAQKIGRSRPHITNTLRLLNLPPAVQKRVAAGVLSAGHARALLSLDDAQAQDRLAHRIVSEGLSVRAVEEIVALGDDRPEKTSRKPAATKPVAPALRHLADRLSDVFETKVKVELGRNKGKIVVEFASIDDLERIVKSMSPEAAGAGGTEGD
ncbi:MAG: ParB/RepB/Spo0J family partition protein [Actinobacteria bacterium]|nr:ParB/RepB/Spo0J family partition protein [Actinomycetota bacterium]